MYWDVRWYGENMNGMIQLGVYKITCENSDGIIKLK